ncbi:MAG: hypothetical protein AAGA54_25955 [Myxococcota bacterium]
MSKESLAPVDDGDLLRSARQPRRRAIFTVLLLLVMAGGVALAPILGLIGGIALGLASGGLLVIIFNLTSRAPKAISSAYTAGATACPACGSVQTDLVVGDGAPIHKCFSCNHSW